MTTALGADIGSAATLKITDSSKKPGEVVSYVGAGDMIDLAATFA